MTVSICQRKHNESEKTTMEYVYAAQISQLVYQMIVFAVPMLITDEDLSNLTY